MPWGSPLSYLSFSFHPFLFCLSHAACVHSNVVLQKYMRYMFELGKSERCWTKIRADKCRFNSFRLSSIVSRRTIIIKYRPSFIQYVTRNNWGLSTFVSFLSPFFHSRDYWKKCFRSAVENSRFISADNRRKKTFKAICIHLGAL